MGFRFDNTYRRLPDTFYKLVNPETAKEPILLFFNRSLAKELGIPLRSNEKNPGVAVYTGKLFKTQSSETRSSEALEDSSECPDYAEYLSGSKILPGSEPIAQAYAGHQFGHFTTLGDGRAHLLGEHLTPSNERFDIQLKGSGRTPYSRGGDGRATAPAMLREYIISEAMHALGIPTTRSLAVVLTNLPVYREEVNHGAVLTRVASSHIRVGTFEYAYHLLDEQCLRILADYSIDRHYPHVKSFENPVLEFFREVAKRQAGLITDWMRVGFIHGVMNTDNMSIAGETIDYGPCAFMNSYDPATVFSSIDRNGRYAFGNQPGIAQWNLACLANSLLPLMDPDSKKAVEKAKEVLDGFAEEFDSKYWKMMGSKIGFSQVGKEEKVLIEELRAWMKKANADYTNTFLAIESLYAEDFENDREDNRSKVDLEGLTFPRRGLEFWKFHPEFMAWYENWKSLIRNREILSRSETPRSVLQRMQEVNPFTIPRNHLVESALDSVRGDTIRTEDLAPVSDFIRILEDPYQRKEDLGIHQQPPEGGDKNYRTFCGT